MTPPGTRPASAAHRHPPVWALVSAAWLGPALLATFTAWMRGAVNWRELLWEGGDWLIYGLLTPAVFLVARRLPLTREHLVPRLIAHFAASVVLCAAWAGGGIILWRWTHDQPGTPYDGGATGWFFTSLPFGAAVYFAVLGVERATTYFLEARERETQTVRLSAQLAEARLGALRMQMQPHFLLNSLNAITVIVRDKDTATATRMLEHLGEILRRVMRTGRPAEVPLEEELDFVRQYLAIEEIRFSDRLRPVFDVDVALLRATVPEFLLQPLVENALRHGLARRVTATLLRIEARREGDQLVLTVTDDGPGGGVEERTGVGLANTRARLATLYGERARLTLAPTAEGGTAAVIRLPYREVVAGAEPQRG